MDLEADVSWKLVWGRDKEYYSFHRHLASILPTQVQAGMSQQHWRSRWSIRKSQSFWSYSWGEVGQCGWCLFFPPWNSQLWAPVGRITQVLEGVKHLQKAGQTPEHTLEILSKLNTGCITAASLWTPKCIETLLKIMKNCLYLNLCSVQYRTLRMF